MFVLITARYNICPCGAEAFLLLLEVKAFPILTVLLHTLSTVVSSCPSSLFYFYFYFFFVAQFFISKNLDCLLNSAGGSWLWHLTTWHHIQNLPSFRRGHHCLRQREKAGLGNSLELLMVTASCTKGFGIRGARETA